MVNLETWGGLPEEAKRVFLNKALTAPGALYRPEFTSTVLANTHVLEAVIREVRRIRAAGVTRYSMRTIVEVLRHHSYVRQRGSSFKINDHMAPDLARLVMAMFPELGGFFELRNNVARASRKVAA